MTGTTARIGTWCRRIGDRSIRAWCAGTTTRTSRRVVTVVTVTSHYNVDQTNEMRGDGVDIVDEMEWAFVRERLAAKYYKRYCRHNKLDPWPLPPKWAFEYADDSLEVLSINDDTVDLLRRDGAA